MFRKITCAGLVLILSSVVSAATIQWNNIASGNWEDANSWDAGVVPTINDQVLAYRTDGGTCVINVTTTVAVAEKLQMKYGTSTLNINQGCSLTNNGSAEIYALPLAGGAATVNVYGNWTCTPGTYPPYALKLGGDAPAIINIYGVLTLHNDSNDATLEMGHSSGGSGTLIIYSSGVANIDAYYWAGACSALIDVKSGGILNILGDVRTQAQTDIDAGHIVGNGIPGNVTATFDGVKTILCTSAPSPDPMTWYNGPHAAGTTAISMTATTATGTDGVEYFFACTAGGGHDSGWQDSPTYSDTGLMPGKTYTYTVKARDKSPNQYETGASSPASATTASLTSGTGSIYAWGYNAFGECNVPAPNTNFTAISAGEHSLGLKADGSVVAWGVNNYGECNVPPPNTGFVAISAGAYHNLCLKSDGSIVAWGGNSSGECNVPSPNTNFVAVAAGIYRSLGLKGDGSIVSWPAHDGPPEPNTDFVAIAESYHSLGLKANGSIVAWGYNAYGECNVPSPNTGFVAISAGVYHSLGLKSNGSIIAWGRNNYGQCTIPEPNTGFVAISAGRDHSLGLKTDGSIVTWGQNSDYYPVPSPNTGFIAIAAGAYHRLGLKPVAPAVGNTMNWMGTVDTAWHNPNNWDKGQVPGPTDDAIIRTATGNVPHFTTASTTDNGVMFVSVGCDSNSGAFYMDSGTLNVNYGFAGTKGGSASAAATATMAGGTIKIWGRNWPDDGHVNGGAFQWPQGNNTTATFNMNGGLIDTLSWDLPYASTSSTGVFNLNAGTVNIRNPYVSNDWTQGFYIGENRTRNTKQNGVLNITGGTLILQGDYRALISRYVNVDKVIVPYPEDSDLVYNKYIVCDYDDRNDGKTTVTAGKTAIEKAWNHSPFDGQKFASRTAALSWSSGQGANSHDVYFGTSNPPPFIQNQSGTSYDPGLLEPGQTYYWKITEVSGGMKGLAAGETIRMAAGGMTTEGTDDTQTFGVAGPARGPDPPSPPPPPTEVDPNRVLSLKWTPGAYAKTHNVYYGTNSASLPLLQGGLTNPSKEVTPDVDKNYYWRVDEVNTTTVPGTVWNFATAEHLRVDDFEGYDIYQLPNAWHTDYDCPGYDAPGVSVATGDVPHHYGLKAMEIAYNVHGCSQWLWRDFGAAGQNWSESATGGAKTLTIWLRGKGNNKPAQSLFVELEDIDGHWSDVYHPDANSLLVSETWTAWNISLSSFAPVNLSKVRYMSIIIEGLGQTLYNGHLYIDDVRLYRSRCVPDNLRDAKGLETADVTDDCVVDWKDINVAANDWLKSDANVVPDAILKSFNFDGSDGWIAGKYGNAVKLDGVNDWVDIDDLAVGPFVNKTISFWFKINGYSSEAYLFGTSDEWRANIRIVRDPDHDALGIDACVGPGTATPDFFPYPYPDFHINVYQWNHVALAVGPLKSTGDVDCKLYVNVNADGLYSAMKPVSAHYYPYLSGMCIGALNNGSAQFAAVSIDDFRIYNRELTGPEIYNIKNGTYPADTPLIEYDFNGSGAQTSAPQTGSLGRRYHSVGSSMASPVAVSPAEIYANEQKATGDSPLRYVNLKDYSLIAKYWLQTIDNWPSP